jgi:hypothetical protein
VRGKSHARFLGEEAVVTMLSYPTLVMVLLPKFYTKRHYLNLYAKICAEIRLWQAARR